MKNKFQKISVIPLWARFCAVGLFYVFIHFSVVLPFTDFQQVDIAVTENMGDKEGEIETEELDEVVESTIDNMFPPMVVQQNLLAELAVNALNNLHYNLFGPPPESI